MNTDVTDLLIEHINFIFSRSSSAVKVNDQSLRSREENVSKAVGATSSEGSSGILRKLRKTLPCDLQ